VSDGSDRVGETLLLGGVVVAVPLLLALPAALLVHSRRGAWLDRIERAAETRRTACVLAGAGVVLAEVLVWAVLSNVRPLRWAAVAWAAAALAAFVVGFAAGARNQGRRMLGREDGVSCLVLGWLARAGATAVPFLWPAVAAYLVCVSCGAPIVALLAGDGGKRTTEPSPGSSPSR
jgi:hypothetical protein